MRRLRRASLVLAAAAAGIVPLTAHAQVGKHVSVGGSAAIHTFADDHFEQGLGAALLYRVRPEGNESDGLAWGPSVTLGFSNADFRTDVGGADLTVGSVRSIPVMAGFGPHYRSGRWWTGVSVTAGASFNHFTVDGPARDAYRDRLGVELESVSAKNAFAAQPALSVWYDVASRLGLYAGVSYFYSRPKASITAGGVTTSETWNMDYMGYAVGAVVGVF